MSNLTAVFHQERIPDTQILSSFCGNFIPIITCSYNSPEEMMIDQIYQICVQYSTKIQIFRVNVQKNKDEISNKLELLNTYEIFDKIEYSDKFHSLLNNKNLNSIILSLSSYKISIIEYNIQYDTFNTLALYSIDQFFLGGKINTEKAFRIVTSLTYNYIVLLYDENKMSFLKKKKDDKKINNNASGIITGEHSYSDTINGEKYFLPTIYLNDLNIKYNIYNIINIYIPNKNLEYFYFTNSKEENKNKIHIYILYIESKLENTEINNTNTNPKIQNNNNNDNGVEKEENQINFNSYMREKVSLGLLSYNFKTNEYTGFEILFTGIDENAFDFTILEKEKGNFNENIAVIFSAYNLQIVNLKQKTCVNYIMNNSYNFIFTKLYPDSNKYIVDNSFIEDNNNLDLRGSGFLVINRKSFIFSDSKGRLYYTVLDDNNDISFDDVKIDNEYNRLCAPYNKILMLHPFIFFLSSPFSDGVILSYNKELNNYKITDKIISYSPIVNFHLVNDMNNDVKFAFTSGYGENSSLSFVYDQFLFYEMPKNAQEFYDIDYMKSVDYETNEYTKYLLCKLKNQKLVVLQNNIKDLVNISNNIEYNKDLNIINFGEIKINDVNNNEKKIVLIFETEIKLYDDNFNILNTLNNNFCNQNIKINRAKVAENFILLSNTLEKKYFLLGLYKNKIQINNNNNNDIIEIMINENLYIRYKELTHFLYNDFNEVIKANIISKLYLDKYELLSIYRNNMDIEIYDISDFLEYKDNMIIENNENGNISLKLLLKSSYVNYSPAILLSDNLNKNILYRSNSNLIIDFSNSINNIFNINNNESNSNLNSSFDLHLKNSVSFSIDSPDFVYFESLGNICILALTFKSGMLYIYTLYISEMTKDNKEIKSIGFKKKIIEKLINIDYREFFRINLDNLFIPFKNINKKSGILFNLESNRKIIYEINGELCILKINNKNNKSNFSSFCNFNNENINNGFIISEGGVIKYFNIYKDYYLSNYSLFIRTNKINRFPVLLTYIPNYNVNNNYDYYYSYIMIEKEMLSPNKFQYYMTLRGEEKQTLSEIKFDPDETVTECNVIDLPINIGNNNNTKKYIALGINIINDDLGEDNFINAKVSLYTKDNGKFELVYSKDGFKGIITMIQSLHNSILVAEGSKINIYSFIPGEEFIMNKYNYIECKNLTICNRYTNKLLLAGDIINSFNFMYMKYYNNINNNMNPIEIVIDTKDNNNIKVTTCNLWVIHNKKCCILFDEDNNGYIYLLSDNNSTRICDFNINKNINEIKFLRNQNESYYYFYSSLNGSIGFINHIENDVYEKLNYLCDFIYYHFPFNSGVNPKSFYSLNIQNNNNNNYQKPQGRFIDFNILDIFLKLSDKLQDIICNNILGVDKSIIIKSIYDLID